MKKNSKTIDKILMYSVIGVAVLTVIVVGLLVYSKRINDSVKDSTINLGKLNNTTENLNIDTNTQSASTEMGKNVEESKNEIESNIIANNTVSNTIKSNVTTNTSTSNKTNQTTSTNKVVTNTSSNKASINDTKATAAEAETKELSFEQPVDGEIVREFAKDNLIYSSTLEEWTTHMGIDIKADKTTVVKAAEEGTIKSIKNDPRYGLTIVIEHSNNFQTVYSNLLTSEFVVEGEKVEKGQSIGTVGNTAVFEIVDEPHLHFEILKDSLQVDPSIYLK